MTNNLVYKAEILYTSDFLLTTQHKQSRAVKKPAQRHLILSDLAPSSGNATPQLLTVGIIHRR